MSSPHVLIIGAGMSGLTLAQQLKKNNISFTVFERDLNRDSRRQGWALSLFGEAFDLMKTMMPPELGPVEQTSHLLPLKLPPQFSFYDITRPDFRVGVIADDTLKVVRANRRRMRDWLMQNIDVKFNKRLLRVEEHGDKVTAFFEDGTSATGDFLVSAEGTRSVVRKHLLQGQDVMKPLPIGSIFGEISLSGDDFSQQLTLSHSNYIVMDPRLGSDEQTAIFCALNRVSPDGKTGYYYYILLWVDKQAPKHAGEKRWTESASKEQLAAFAREKTRGYPDKLRTLVDKIPTEGYNTPGFQLQSVELEPEQLPAGRVLLIGDAAHSMAPCKSHDSRVFPCVSISCIGKYTDMRIKVRALAANTAFVDAFRLGKVLTRARDMQASGEALKDLVLAFNVDMLARGKAASKVSNTVLEAYGEEAKFITFGREAGPMPPKPVVLSNVTVVG
jgi:2-polyprenyl-6-methoxyphenol hydroxylase-like FAD-dependent oxidoreductase